MVKTTHQPADKFFKEAMRDKRVASGFFSQHLPQRLQQKLVLETLQLNPTSFVDDSFKQYESDLVYRVQTTSAHSCYLYLLLEKQSTVDKMMAFRLVRYSILLLEQHRKQQDNRNALLPVVYPMVIYSGKPRWTAPRSIMTLFEEPELAARHWLNYQLIDLQRLDDEVLAQETWSGLMQIALKNQKVIELKGFLEQLFGLLEQLADDKGSGYGKLVMRYIFQGLEAEGRHTFIEVANAQRDRVLRGDAMTLAQEFEEHGRQIGLQQGIELGKEQGIELGKEQGIELGKEQGIEEGKLAIAKKLYAAGTSLDDIASLTELPLVHLKEQLVKRN